MNVGKAYKKNGEWVIEREIAGFNDGYHFKSYDNWSSEDNTLPVYQGEFNEDYYTREDFEGLVGDKKLARELFEDVDWQSPETLFLEWEQVRRDDYYIELMNKANKGGTIMKINGKKVKGTQFAYDGCHKIYIIEDDEDLINATEVGYTILPITDLEHTYNNSCSLKFISNWKLDTTYVRQFDEHMCDNLMRGFLIE